MRYAYCLFALLISDESSPDFTSHFRERDAVGPVSQVLHTTSVSACVGMLALFSQQAPVYVLHCGSILAPER